ncbi:MAG: hypothetical protein MZU97_08810 [Bacillus subtilis]|nr:hypothetical protein [Bacillus subtilis]
MLRNLLKFRGDIFPVNPKYDELMGVRSYRSVPDLPRPRRSRHHPRAVGRSPPNHAGPRGEDEVRHHRELGLFRNRQAGPAG